MTATTIASGSAKNLVAPDRRHRRTTHAAAYPCTSSTPRMIATSPWSPPVPPRAKVPRRSPATTATGPGQPRPTRPASAPSRNATTTKSHAVAVAMLYAEEAGAAMTPQANATRGRQNWIAGRYAADIATALLVRRTGDDCTRARPAWIEETGAPGGTRTHGLPLRRHSGLSVVAASVGG